jgi:hypothetical protein
MSQNPTNRKNHQREYINQINGLQRSSKTNQTEAVLGGFWLATGWILFPNHQRECASNIKILTKSSAEQEKPKFGNNATVLARPLSLRKGRAEQSRAKSRSLKRSKGYRKTMESRPLVTSRRCLGAQVDGTIVAGHQPVPRGLLMMCKDCRDAVHSQASLEPHQPKPEHQTTTDLQSPIDATGPNWAPRSRSIPFGDPSPENVPKGKRCSERLTIPKQTATRRTNMTDNRKARLAQGETVVVSVRKKDKDAMYPYAQERGLFTYCGDRTRRTPWTRSPWHNPFKIDRPHPDTGAPMTRDDVCDLFAERTLPTLDVTPLRGKALGCWCYPERCHCNEIALVLAAA